MRARFGALLAATFLTFGPMAANAAECSVVGTENGQEFIAGAQCVSEPTPQPIQGESGGSGTSGPVKVTYPVRCEGGVCIPNPNFTCEDPAERYLLVWVQSESGNWVVERQGCMDPLFLPIPPSTEITPGMVLEALRRIALPESLVTTNPPHKTLVSLQTVFYAMPQTVTRNLTILGQSVLVEATPSSFLWHFGDGEWASTDSPGAPYPAMDVTHRYLDADVTVRPSVDTTYTARFRVNGGAWRDVDGTVTIDGPPIELRVVEATPVLSGSR